MIIRFNIAADLLPEAMRYLDGAQVQLAETSDDTYDLSVIAAGPAWAQSAIEDVKRLHLEPGDTLVLRIPDQTPLDEVGRMAEQMAAAFPEHKTVILGRGLELDVVSEPAWATYVGIESGIETP